MQTIARNQNLSETVFPLAPQDATNDARVRIFTPRAELPFAGHPMVAAAHILTEERLAAPAPGEPLRIETGAGVIPVEVHGSPARYTMTQATPTFAPGGTPAAQVARAVGLDANEVLRTDEVSTGLPWLVAQVASIDAMTRVRPDRALLAELAVAIYCIGADADDADVHVRAFVAPLGVPEDPVTGSANGCIAAAIARYGLMPARDGELRYVAEQGAEVDQPGRVFAHVTGVPDSLTVRIGGHAVTTLRGELLLNEA
jgi:PhzF family phenazine biosynthesis protein